MRTLPLYLLLLALLLPYPAHACLNDRDTVAEEAKNLPDVLRVITGRFERNPPLYYEMRLARVAKELQANPALLSDYDDAGVACDRLGRDDEAIDWMERKRALLDRRSLAAPAVKEQWYRYNANVGTFWVHRWIRQGADRRRIAEVNKARGYIAQAILIKPDAHFGREASQLQVMNWLALAVNGNQVTLSEFLQHSPAGRDIKGLAGLIALGNAWESVDVFDALAQSRGWQDGMRSHREIAYLAQLRCFELIDQGHGSLMPGSPTGPALKRVLRPVAAHRKDDDEQIYRRLRAEAEDWQAKRTAYMMARLTAGRHPDTDPTFWNDYHDPGPPRIPMPWDRQMYLTLGRPLGMAEMEFWPFVILIGLVLALVALNALPRYLRRRRQRRTLNAAKLSGSPRPGG